MKYKISDIKYLEKLFESFYDIGTSENGGVTRLGYSEVEDQMHAVFKKLGEELGCRYMQDEVGNSFVMNSQDHDYYLIASHLDSVIDGGRYDGVSGIMTGLIILKWAKEEGLKIPIRICAFRCEESSNFGHCTIGSNLVSHSEPLALNTLVSKAGEKLSDIFAKRGYNPNPPKISGIKEYIELHIEQGKVLEEQGLPIGIVQTIAGPKRFRLYLKGKAEHSGATPMGMRSDAMCAASEIILAIEKIGMKEAAFQSVATVGVVNNHPNAMNVIPGEVELGVDLRGIDPKSLARMEFEVHRTASEICKKRGIGYMEVKIGDTAPVDMSQKLQAGLEAAAGRLGIPCRRMASGAGHDAMSFPSICDTGMVFIPCLKGISHNHEEFTSLFEILQGARVIYEYLKGEIK